MKVVVIFALIVMLAYCSTKNEAEAYTESKSGTRAKGGNNPESNSYVDGLSFGSAKGKNE